MTNSLSRRRTNAVAGFVNWPLDRPSSGEGGMFVRLVVIDTRADADWGTKWVPCCGGYQSFLMDETFMGDDAFDRDYPSEGADPARWTERDEAFAACERRHFPHLKEDGPYQYHSREYLAVVTLGATGWSRSDWVCRYDDLTDRGRDLYNQIKSLYAGAEIRLLTFLDT